MVERKVATRLVLAVSMAFSGSASQAQTPGEGFDVVGHRLWLKPDADERTVVGRQLTSIRVSDPRLKSLVFTPNALTLDRVSIDGLKVVPIHDSVVLAVPLPRPVRLGETVRLEIRYHGRPARGVVASRTGLYTSYFACDWMICAQNAFADKASFSLDLLVPTGTTTLSVGRSIGRRSAPGGREWHMWRSPRPYSAYLYGFALGNFARNSIASGASKLTFLSDVAEAADLSTRFEITKDVASFFAEKAGIALPVREYAQLLVAGDEAQEAATYSVLGSNVVPAKRGTPEEDWAIAHELAHQWWGNAITCATLSDFWLNEGITTFMTAAWKEHRYGRTAYEAELTVARRRLAAARDKGFDKPLTWPGPYPSLGLRRAVQYSKGALFMAELRERLGERAFWEGLKQYTRRHAGGVVVSSDLQRAMEAAGRRDLGPLFAQWVYTSPS